MSWHIKEIEVRRMLLHDKGQTRTNILRQIRNDGNNRHNLKVRAEKKGDLIVRRAPGVDENPDIDHFVPCDICHEWFSRKQLYRHKCLDPSIKPSLKKSLEIVAAASFSDRHEGMARVLKSMADDEIGRVAKSDFLLLEALRFHSESGCWKQKKWCDQMRIKLRYGARLLLELRKSFPHATFNEVLTKDNFYAIVEATKACAVSESGYVYGETAMKIGHVISDLINRADTIAILQDDHARRSDLMSLAALKEKNWGGLVVKGSRLLMSERKRNAVIQLPKTEDVVKFAKGLSDLLEQAILALEDDKTLRNYRELQEVALAKCIQYSRRRGQDVATITVLDVKNAQEARDSMLEDIYAGLTENQKKIASEHHLITVRGKNNLDNHVLLTIPMKHALDMIINNRKVGCILPENPYVFATPHSEESFLRPSAILKRFQEYYGVQHMETRNMRKYLATSFQVIFYFKIIFFPM